MANADVITYSIAAFIAALFLLEAGADKFVDSTAIIARRTGISETTISLLTVGGEWEELAVVIASLIRKRSSLAEGNIIGSAISNILGAFSIGLLFYPSRETIQFDKSSRVYSAVLLLVTTFSAAATYFSNRLARQVCGIASIAIFVAYLGSIGYAISHGSLTAPADLDSDSDLEGSGSSVSSSSSSLNNNTPAHAPYVTESDPLLATRPSGPTRRAARTLTYHVFSLIFGLLAIALAGFILSHGATDITDEFGISDVVFGVVILAIATTLPEKFVAVISGRRGHAGILAANTAGSNIFLLTLCSGIVMLDSPTTLESGKVSITELGVLWVSTVAFTATVWFGKTLSRLVGFVMLLAYVVFIIFELMDVNRVQDLGQ